MSTPKELIHDIAAYYQQSQTAYLNWGKDLERDGVYAVHFGLDEQGESDHYCAVGRLTTQVIETADVFDGAKILDAGCGSGAISFKIADRFPNTTIIGINISPEQVNSGQRFKSQQQIQSVHFSLQDYLRLGFNAEVFDRVIFCESFTHSFDKSQLLQEVARVLKPGGKIIIFDALTINEIDPEAIFMLKHMRDGWSIPGIPTFPEFMTNLTQSGFTPTSIKNLSSRVTASINFMGNHAEAKIAQDGTTPESSYQMRLACIATRDLLNRGTIGYFAISATKNA